MAEEIVPPFSARSHEAHAQIDNDFPEKTRIGLLHLLNELVEKDYVPGWKAVIAELERIARIRPSGGSFPSDVDELLLKLPWEKVFDFCERLYGHLGRDVTRYDDRVDEVVVVVERSKIQQYISRELQRLFVEDDLAFEFSEGLVRRRGRRNTSDQIARAELVLGDPRLSAARTQFNKALKYFRNPSEPDFENVVKEAVCAVEATARALFPAGGTTLGEVTKSITGNAVGQIPKGIAKTFHGLYGFSSGGDGIRHGGGEGGEVTKELAEYCLALASSQIALLVDLAVYEDIPF